MAIHLYMSCFRVEALIASQLDPEEFGAYMAVGTEKLSRGQVIFFEIDPQLRSDYFDLERARRECVPHPDGAPKRSHYISIYRVLEHLDLSTFGKLYLTTTDGRTLGIDPRPYDAASDQPGAHLYQELCPVSPLIASAVAPGALVKFITDSANPISVPRIFFADLLADRDATGRLSGSLPYRHPEHLEFCLREVAAAGGKKTKTIERDPGSEFFYRTLRGGFYLGDPTGVKLYPFPDKKELLDTHYYWWRSATM
jgi:hypothetical protein